MPDESTYLSNIHKIAVLRANGLGDFIFVVPALTALRETYREAEIVYIGKPLHKALLTGRPGPVDRVEIAPVSHGVRQEPGQEEDPEEVAAFLERMRAEKFDLALQLHGGGRNSNPFILKMGATYTAGTRTPDAAALDFWIPYVYYQREILRWLEVVSLVGARTDKIVPQVTVMAGDLEEATMALQHPDKPFAVLHPGSTDPRRQWSPQRFASVGNALVERGLDVYVTGTRGEDALAEEVVALMAEPATNLCGALSISGMTGLLALTSLLVANDTGPLHLAAAVGASTVGIYWGPNLINAGPITRRNHRPQLSWMLECPLCGTDMMREDANQNGETVGCAHDTSFVAKVSLDDVLAAVHELLEQNGVRKPTIHHREPVFSG
jgi:ADP-heptose:LPS heptosyltransferase